MNINEIDIPEWAERKKTIRELILELQSFEDQDLVVMLTNDEGQTFQSVKLVSKGFDQDNIYCALHY